MQTTIMFINGNAPLAGVLTRIKTRPEEILVTDNEGRIEIEIEEGRHVFEVQIDDQWFSREVNKKGNSILFIIDIAQSLDEHHTTLNAIQVSISSLVGDRFLFQSVLGRGGMGVVIKAIDKMADHEVAIKMLSDEIRDNEEAQQLFLIEARNLAMLSHPNLVSIYDILNVSGQVLMVFEYVPGKNIAELVREEDLDQIDVIKMMLQIAHGVAYLHENEILHQDLKPANFIYRNDEKVKIIDFGLARSFNDLYARGKRVRGTPAYMAPEQFRGINLTVGTDIYQLGVSMFQMLTGVLPFPAGDMAYEHVHVPAPSVDDFVEGIDVSILDLVARCLSKKVADRPRSANAFFLELKGILQELSPGDFEKLGLEIENASASGSFLHLSPLSEPSFDESLLVDDSSAHHVEPYYEEYDEIPQKNKNGLYFIFGVFFFLLFLGGAAIMMNRGSQKRLEEGLGEEKVSEKWVEDTKPQERAEKKPTPTKLVEKIEEPDEENTGDDNPGANSEFSKRKIITQPSEPEKKTKPQFKEKVEKVPIAKKKTEVKMLKEDVEQNPDVLAPIKSKKVVVKTMEKKEKKVMVKEKTPEKSAKKKPGLLDVGQKKKNGLLPVNQ